MLGKRIKIAFLPLATGRIDILFAELEESKGRTGFIDKKLKSSIFVLVKFETTSRYQVELLSRIGTEV